MNIGFFPGVLSALEERMASFIMELNTYLVQEAGRIQEGSGATDAMSNLQGEQTGATSPS